MKFLSRTGGYTVFLTGDEAVLELRGKKIKKSLPRALKPASLAGSGGATTALFPGTYSATSSSRDTVASGDVTSPVLRRSLVCIRRRPRLNRRAQIHWHRRCYAVSALQRIPGRKPKLRKTTLGNLMLWGLMP